MADRDVPERGSQSPFALAQNTILNAIGQSGPDRGRHAISGCFAGSRCATFIVFGNTVEQSLHELRLGVNLEAAGVSPAEDGRYIADGI